MPPWKTGKRSKRIARMSRTMPSVTQPAAPRARAAVDSSSPQGAMRREPRVDRWIFSTDGVGWPVPANDRRIEVPEGKRWVDDGACRHAAMFGIGTGIEQNTHKIGEVLDTRELQHAVAFLARYPGALAAQP